MNVFTRGLLVATVAVSLTGCKAKTPAVTDTAPATDTSNTTATTPTTTDLTTLLPATFDADTAAHLAQADVVAKVWHADAVLSYVSITLPTLEPKKGNEVYVFGSASDLDNWYTYSLSQDTGKSVRAIIPKADYLGDKITPINQTYWKMNYVKALQLAEQNGGATFRISNPNPQISVFLSNRTPRGWLWWTVEYKTASGQNLSLLINPNLGGVIDETGKQLVPDSTTSTPAASTTAQ